MTIQSMTGFARIDSALDPDTWSWELRAVNGKGFDLRTRLPQGFDDLGEVARKRLAAGIKRGTLSLALTLTRAPRPQDVRINEPLLASLIELCQRRAVAGIAPASLDGLLSVRGVVDVVDSLPDESQGADLRAALVATLNSLIEQFEAARRTEGQTLRDVLVARLDEIERLALSADDAPSRRPEAIAKRLGEQIATLTGQSSTLDASRLHQEAILMATKADIREEIDRLNAHVAAARSAIEAGGAIGRKLDFLAQEFGREANTLCAKAADVALSTIGLELKSVVEQFREQCLNIE